jgi:hypothetical protein
MLTKNPNGHTDLFLTAVCVFCVAALRAVQHGRPTVDEQ